MTNNEILLKIVIDGKEANATINLTDSNIKELYKSFKYGKQEVNGLTTAISQGFNNAREIIIGFKESYGVISQAFSTHLKEYQEQEVSLIKLTTALKQTGQYTETNIKSLVDYSSQLEKTTIYGDELTQSVMAQLLAMGLSVEQTKEATLQAANLASVMGTDINTAARAMADLFNGNTGMIGKYVKGLDEAVIKSGDLNKILAMLNERIGWQAVAIGQSGVGALAKMSHAIGDLKKNTGQLLSNALSPFIKSISDIVNNLNDLNPQLSGIIGLTGSLTTAIITLRVTGILPAIKSFELLGITITGLRATLIKTGIGALLVGLGYALWELAKAYEHFADVRNQKEQSFANTLSDIKDEAAKATKEQRDRQIKSSTESVDKIKQEIEGLNREIEQSKSISKIKDKEGNEYIVKQETDKTKQLREQLNIKQQQLKVEEATIEIYKEANNIKLNSKKSTDGELNKIFDRNKSILSEQQRHESAMLKLQTDNDLILLSQKIEHFNQMILLYKKYGQDVTQLENQRREAELELTIKSKTEIKIDEELPFEAEELADVQYGNVLDYARLSKQQELDIWYNTELEKVKLYENSAEIIAALDEEYLRRKQDILNQQTEAQINATRDALTYIAGAYGKHTLVSKLAGIANATISTYEAATKALTAGPFLGPLLAGLITAAGLANVAKIASVEPPSGVAYERGGFALVGEKGPEIIAPVVDYAQGQSMLINAVVSRLNASVNDKVVDKIINKLDNWYNRLEFRIKQQDLYASWEQQNNFRLRYD